MSQALIGVYSTVGVSWIFIYFRDSFITKQDRYRWAEPFDLYREGEQAAPSRRARQFLIQRVSLRRLGTTATDIGVSGQAAESSAR